MSHAPETPESPVRGPERSRRAGTPKNRHKAFTPLRKALAACAVAGLLLTGAGFASNGFTANPFDAFAAQTHDSQANSGALSGHNAAGKGGLGIDAVKAVPVAKTDLVNVPAGVQHAVGEKYGTVSIPRLGLESYWKHYLVEGVSDENLALPGTDDPSAVKNHESAVAHNTGTSELGQIGNAVLEAHRTTNTFRDIDALEIGDPISITESKTGTVYTYAVTQTMVQLPFVTAAEQDKAWSAQDPIPFDDSSISTPGHPAKNPATKRLLTLTSCGTDIKPDATSDWRVYVIAELQSVTAGTAAK